MKTKERRREIRAMKDEEIGVELRTLRAKIVTLRTQQVTEKVENNRQFRSIRRDIARLLTERARRASGT